MAEILFSYAGSDRQKCITARHSHRGWELLYISSGKCTLLFPEETRLVGQRGSVFLIPPHTSHERWNSIECRTFYAVYETTEASLSARLRQINTNNDRLIRLWFGCLPKLNDAYETEQAATLIQLILLRLDRLEQQQRETEMFHPKLQQVCDYLRTHYNREISIGELARFSGISQSHLNFLFRQQFGTGPQCYLTDLRMKSARQLLLNPNYSIAEVAEQCGFRDVHYFTRRFKAFHGAPPGLYRREPSHFADTENR